MHISAQSANAKECKDEEPTFYPRIRSMFWNWESSLSILLLVCFNSFGISGYEVKENT